MDASKILDAIENGAKLVVVDPVYTTTASKADLWLPVEPGKDVHLALAMMHTVFEDETYDEDFLRKRTTAPALIRKDTGSSSRRATSSKTVARIRSSPSDVVAVAQSHWSPKPAARTRSSESSPSTASRVRRHSRGFETTWRTTRPRMSQRRPVSTQKTSGLRSGGLQPAVPAVSPRVTRSADTNTGTSSGRRTPC